MPKTIFNCLGWTLRVHWCEKEVYTRQGTVRRIIFVLVLLCLLFLDYYMYNPKYYVVPKIHAGFVY